MGAMRTYEYQPLKGYEGLYLINRNGDIFSTRRNKKMTHYPNSSGHKQTYMLVCLRKDGVSKNKFVHRLLALQFIPNPENKNDINHINGIGTDNRLENIEWATESENALHMYRTGLKIMTIENKMACVHKSDKLNKDLANDIRKEWATKEFNQNQLAEKYKVDQTTISKVVNNHLWA